MSAAPVIPGATIPNQTQIPQAPVPIPTAPLPTPFMQQREMLVAPTIVPIPPFSPPVNTSSSSDATADSPSSDGSGSSAGTSETSTNNPGMVHAADGHDPLASNPLPTPPKESAIPEHLISGTAMTQHTPNLPHSPQQIHSQPPLSNPLPPLPPDVYDTPKYRGLTMGNGYHHAIHPGTVYPTGWFDSEMGIRREREDYRERERAASVVGSSSSMPIGASLTRRFTNTMKRLARVGGSRFRRGRSNTTPMPFPAPFPGSPGTEHLYGMGARALPSTSAAATTPMFYAPNQAAYVSAPATGMQMPDAHQVPGANGPQSPSSLTSMSMSPISPTVQIHRPAPLHFDRNSPFALPSTHSILYKKKLYPTALHLLEAHKFLGVRNDFAERVRQTRTVDELNSLAVEIEPYRRRDWEGIVMNRVQSHFSFRLVMHS